MKFGRWQEDGLGRRQAVAGVVMVCFLLTSCATAIDDDVQANAGEEIDSSTSSSSASESKAEESAPTPQPAEGEPAAESTPPAEEQVAGDLAMDALVPVVFSSFGDADGSVWNVRVGEVSDVTASVLAANEFNDSPPDGVVFAGFDVEMTLVEAGKEPLSPGFNFTWEILGGSSSAVYDATTMADVLGCGVTNGEFNDFAEVFVGGSISGLVCVPLPQEDLGALGTRVAMNFSSGDRTTFATGGATPAVAEATAATGSSSSEITAFGVEVPVVFSSFGDADGSVWNVRVGEVSDVTASVLAANGFNDPPPDGVVFAGFDVEMTLVEAEKEPLSPGFNFTWEILGGSSSAVYDATTMADVLGCGVTNGEFNDFAEVFVGGSISGLVCVPLPQEDLGASGTRVAMNFSSGDRTTFGS